MRAFSNVKIRSLLLLSLLIHNPPRVLAIDCTTGKEPIEDGRCDKLCAYFYEHHASGSSGCFNPSTSNNLYMSCAQACDAMIKGSSQGQCFESCKNDNSTCEISIDLSSGQVEKYE